MNVIKFQLRKTRLTLCILFYYLLSPLHSIPTGYPHAFKYYLNTLGFEIIGIPFSNCITINLTFIISSILFIIFVNNAV